MNRKTILAAAACAATLAVTQAAMAQLSLTGTSYSQNFDLIAASLPTGWSGRTGAGSNALGTPGAYTATPVSWVDTAGSFKNFASSTGQTGAETVAQQAALTDRAFGIRQTGSFGDPGAAFTLQLSNTTGRTGFSFNFNAEMLSVQTRSTVWTLQYGLGTTPTTFTDLATYNDPGTFGSITLSVGSAALTGIENQSQNVWLRLVALSASTGTGSRDSIGINNFQMAWTGEGPVSSDPRNLVWNGGGNWEAPSTWLDGANAATFESTRPDNAVFSNGGLPAAVTLGTGITVGSLTFAATAPVHTLSGGSLTTTGPVTFNQSAVLNTPITVAGTGSQTWSVASGKSVNVNQALSGSQLLVKAGTGDLVLAAASPTYTGGVTINAGTVSVTAVDANNFAGLGTGSTVVNATGTLKIDNVALGSGLNANGPAILLNDGGTLVATGTSSYGRSGGALSFGNGTNTHQNIEDLKTLNATDVFTLQSSLRQGTSGAADTFTTVRVSGPGRIVLESGGTTAATGYRGNWELNGGILQIGPAVAGGFGEPLNALGQKASFASFNPITINGGVFAVATNTANTATSGSDFPTSVRSPITLAGGALGVIGSGSLDESNNNGARFSGDLTVKAGPASTIQLYDAIAGVGTPHNVVIASETAAAPKGNVTWEASSTLNVTGGGVLSIIRDTTNGGTVSVGAGAQMVVNSGATVNLGGTMDALSDGTNSVNVSNAGSFNVTNATKTIGNLSSTGTTTVSNAVNLSANSVRQGTVAIGTAGVVSVRAGATPNDPAHTSVIKNLAINGGPGSPTGTLDLTNTSMVLDYDGVPASHANDVRLLLKNGVDTARGIISSSADAAHRLGYGDNSVLNKTTFAGQNVDASSVLIKYTYGGDANLDGQVDVTDLGALATAWQTSAPWTGGDFNYDGFVDVSDLGVLATNWQLGVGSPLGPGSLDAAMAAVGLGGVSVPEPASIGLLGLGLVGMLARRSRRA